MTAAENNPDAELSSSRRSRTASPAGILYQVETTAPWHITLLFVIQTTVITAPGQVVISALIHSSVCGGDDYGFLAELVAISLIICGFGTILQITVGIRLPIIQGLSFTFLPPLYAAMSSDKYKCPVENATSSYFNETYDANLPPWNPRIRVVSGSLMVAAAIQVLLGLTGVFGLILPYIGPLTIAPAVSLIGLSLYPSVIASSQHQWGIAILTATIVISFAIGLRDKLIALTVPWLLCYILTVTDTFPNDPSHQSYLARTDVKTDGLKRSAWFFFPYPGMWGPPLFDVGITVSFLAASLVGIFESVGDYYVLAKCCKKPTPPKHALNRALAVEGVINVISGSLNIGIGTASFSEPVSFINVTGMASRVTWQLFGVSMILAGIIGKFGGALAMIPEPILGGFNITGMGMLASVGISNLQYLDMNSSRNLMTFGVSVIMGLAIPVWVRDKTDIIKTGSPLFDDIIIGLLSTSMFVGATIGFTLDNLLPGTTEERGLGAYRSNSVTNANVLQERGVSVYDFPLISSYKCSRARWCTYFPFLPVHTERKCSHYMSCRYCNRQGANDRQDDIDTENNFVVGSTDNPSPHSHFITSRF